LRAAASGSIAFNKARKNLLFLKKKKQKDFATLRRG
jgi:hypothetical protein